MKNKRWISIITILMVGISAVACGKAISEPEVPKEVNEVRQEVPEVQQNVVETSDTKEKATEQLPEEPATEAEATPVQPEVDESTFLSKAVAAANAQDEDVKDYLVDDFDGDGVFEAFVFIGGEIDEEWTTRQGTLWFVSEENCEEVFKNGSIHVRDDKVIEEYDVGDRIFVGMVEAYATSYVTYLFGVDNGRCIESSASGIGEFYKSPDFDDYCISVSAYDAYYDYEAGKKSEGIPVGHTWKDYYFHYDEAVEDFIEYKGTAISEAELEEACGFDLAGEIRNEGFQYDGAIKRENGIINVNYSKETIYEDGSGSIEYMNATFDERTHKFSDAWEGGSGTWQGSGFGGIYFDSLT